MTGHSGDGFPLTEPLKGLRQILLMEQGRVEAQQSKVQIEQGADAHCGNDGTDAHLTAQPPTDPYNDHLYGSPAKAHRPASHEDPEMDRVSMGGMTMKGW